MSRPRTALAATLANIPEPEPPVLALYVSPADYDRIAAYCETEDADPQAVEMPKIDLSYAADALRRFADTTRDLGDMMRERLEPDPELIAKACSDFNEPTLNRAQRRAKKRGK